MKRENFVEIIKLRSFWKIDKRRGNYSLPSGDRLSNYVEELVKSQMEIDSLAIAGNGNLYYFSADPSGDLEILVSFKESEKCYEKEQEERIKDLVQEIISGGRIWKPKKATNNYYFTFGSDLRFPYSSDDYVMVQAEDLDEACDKFNKKYPPRDKAGSVVNCAFFYTEDQFNKFRDQYYPGEPAEVIA